MKISVIVPSYNQGRFLAECLGSVVWQLNREDELFVVDGGSSDNSVDVIKRFEARVTRWVSEPDRGQAHAVNKGANWATGDAIIWLNSDDALMPDALETLRRHWKSDSQALVFAAVWIDEACTRATVFPAPHKVSLDLFFDGAMPINQPSCILSRKLYQHSGGLDESLHYSLDYDLFVRILKLGVVPQVVQALFAVNRLHGASKTSSGKLPEELERTAQLHFGKLARSYPSGLRAKYGLSLFTLFPADFTLRVLLKRILSGSQLPGGIAPMLAKQVRSWLSRVSSVGI